MENLRPPTEPGAELVPEILLDQKGELELRGAPLKEAVGLICFGSTDCCLPKSWGILLFIEVIYLNIHIYMYVYIYMYI